MEVLILSNRPLPFALPKDRIIDLAGNWTPACPSGKELPEWNVIVDFHGGGFVSGSPSTHEPYLRDWTKHTDTILFSVNYSKAPGAQYPTALNECFSFYKALVQDRIFGARYAGCLFPSERTDRFPSRCSPHQALVGRGFRRRQLGFGRVCQGRAEPHPTSHRHASCVPRARPGQVRATNPNPTGAPDANVLCRTITPSRILFSNDVLLTHHLLRVCLDVRSFLVLFANGWAFTPAAVRCAGLPARKCISGNRSATVPYSGTGRDTSAAAGGPLLRVGSLRPSSRRYHETSASTLVLSCCSPGPPTDLFVQRLDSLGKPYRHFAFEMPHGFLSTPLWPRDRRHLTPIPSRFGICTAERARMRDEDDGVVARVFYAACCLLK